MQVGPEILQALAGETDATASVITENSLAGKVVEAFAGMSGSTSAWAAQAADTFAGDLAKNLSEGFRALAAAARGAAETYEVSDRELADGIEKAFAK
ncbi:hypothetical protein IA539_07480 [Gordonia sp. zg691]|uniref:WXG100 family type VII secretion target n=1 Tax=Gordonia jinghuaiqii TaxID=2758710 RepID=A0A7D7QGX7_9ACTN|nr:type VII secretion target [Gordonia jinghuaiqii]MBD0861055.1 hypothetical protein [Gordonia jinghuaiqii]MCR5979785.1 hypothetical protein [Gordonia jinghuaiqii]QMT00824.1 hypothetical protein H1R19_18360 [Gordonia jinghuaiqii]